MTYEGRNKSSKKTKKRKKPDRNTRNRSKSEVLHEEVVVAQIKRQGLEGGGCGIHPGGGRSVPLKEVGSGCKGEMIQKQP